MGSTDPIGILDSGVGGLTVARVLVDKLPAENFVYFGDTAHVPYGSKNEEQLMGYARDIISFLIRKKVKAILVACGTHSSVTLPHIADQYSLPLLGVLKPGARTAVRSTRNGRIGVIATMASVNSQAYSREIRAINQDCQVIETGCPRFVPLIESGQHDSPESREAVKEYLQPLLRQGIDTLVLGCTHYPFLTPVIRELAGPDLCLVDPAGETIDELQNLLKSRGLLNTVTTRSKREYFVSGNAESFFRVGRLLTGDLVGEVQAIRLD